MDNNRMRFLISIKRHSFKNINIFVKRMPSTDKYSDLYCNNDNNKS